MQHIRHNLGAKPFVEQGYGPENKRCRIGDIHLSFPAFTVAAVSTGFLHFFSEVGKDKIPKTRCGLAVIHHGIQPMVIHPFLVLILPSLLNEVTLDADVPATVKENTFCPGSIPAGTAGLLVIGLQTFGHLVVDDIAHIAFIDSHTEGIGSHHDVHRIEGKIFLRLPSVLIIHTRMVAACADSPANQHIIYLFHRFPGGAVNNAAFLPVAFYIAEDKIFLS